MLNGERAWPMLKTKSDQAMLDEKTQKWLLATLNPSNHPSMQPFAWWSCVVHFTLPH